MIKEKFLNLVDACKNDRDMLDIIESDMRALGEYVYAVHIHAAQRIDFLIQSGRENHGATKACKASVKCARDSAHHCGIDRPCPHRADLHIRQQCQSYAE